MRTLAEAQIDKILRNLDIPSCPVVLAELSRELQKEETNLNRVAQLVGRDVALAAGIMKVANSPLFGLSRQVSSISQGLSLLGVKNMFNLVVGELLKKSLSGADSVMMNRFWDSAAYSARTCSLLARRLPLGIAPELAYTFGLFHDCGMPILMRRYPDYKDTLSEANRSPGIELLRLEDLRHGTNHAVIGYLLARNWKLPDVVAQAIQCHHDFSVLTDPDEENLPEPVLILIALSAVAERVVSLFLRSSDDSEWLHAQAPVRNFLGLGEAECGELVDELLEQLETLQRQEA